MKPIAILLLCVAVAHGQQCGNVSYTPSHIVTHHATSHHATSHHDYEHDAIFAVPFYFPTFSTNVAGFVPSLQVGTQGAAASQPAALPSNPASTGQFDAILKALEANTAAIKQLDANSKTIADRVNRLEQIIIAPLPAPDPPTPDPVKPPPPVMPPALSSAAGAAKLAFTQLAVSRCAACHDESTKIKGGKFAFLSAGNLASISPEQEKDIVAAVHSNRMPRHGKLSEAEKAVVYAAFPNVKE